MRVLIVVSLLCIAMTAKSSIYTVNNQSGFSSDFSSLQNAFNGVLEGDTIYVQPSSLGYGGANLSKRLVVIGGGHDPEYSLYSSYVNSINFMTGATGSIVKGLVLDYISSSNSSNVNDVIISGCHIGPGNPILMGSGSVLNNWIFEGNVITSSYSSGVLLTSLGANLILRNNILANQVNSNGVTNTPAGTLFEHNLIVAPAGYSMNGFVNSSSNIHLRDNIFYLTGTVGTQISTNCFSCIWENNITYHSSVILANLPGTNYNNTDPEFEDVPSVPAYFSYSYDYHLASTSQGLNAATDGTDVGLYGGIFSFSQSGFDAGTPRVGDFTLQTSSAPQGGTITINLKAHGSGQ